ncbi:MAG: hypothetical protein KC645_16745 [Gemmatimonadetes bacterium]|nr:hypothetical protein [Gemmatimonadota bacterium]
MDLLRAMFRWYVLEIAAAFAVVAIFLASPLERLIWAGFALLLGVILVHKHGGDGAGARALRALFGLGALGLGLAGLAILGFGVMVFAAGSFGILAGMVLVPLGITVSGLGWVTLVAMRSRPGPGGIELRMNRMASRVVRLSSPVAPKDPPTPAATVDARDRAPSR